MSTAFGNPRTVVVPKALGDMDDLAGYSQLLQRAPGVTDLVIKAAHFQGHPEDNWQLDDTETEVGVLTKGLFYRLTPFGSHPPLPLNKLELHCLAIDAAPRGLLKVIDFGYFTALSIMRCVSTAALLSSLSEIYQRIGCNLRSFLY